MYITLLKVEIKRNASWIASETAEAKAFQDLKFVWKG
jgi:hypothetical protein